MRMNNLSANGVAVLAMFAPIEANYLPMFVRVPSLHLDPTRYIQFLLFRYILFRGKKNTFYSLPHSNIRSRLSTSARSKSI